MTDHADQRAARLTRRALTFTLGALLSLGAAHADGSLSARDALIRDYVTANHGTVPLSQATRGVHDITLEIHEITTEISPGVKVTQWAFALPGQKPSVPGPELHVRVGEHVRITFRNTHTQPHAIHLHGITSLAQEMDGVPHTSHEVLPGQSFTYEFVATEPGTHAYHCHFQTNVHLDMGMYGALVVDPPEGTREPWTKEHTLILDEWDSRQDPNAATHDVHPDLFLVNGRTFPLIPDVNVPKGETHLLRLINLGSEPHSMHLHGNDFLVIAKDGHDLPLPYRADTLPILPGERYDLLVTGRDGAFPFHDHNTSENTNRGVYPGGMHLLVTGSPALKADGTPDLTSPAGHDHAGMTDMAGTSTAPVTTTAPAVTPP
ncbi:multicopper oxidase family protein, partial [Deinococcus pimensis]|uniref:multicopper oxidase family protein n=1 Tax=Deinococcus pimensis TaxID=309888 RepID=UPI000693BD69